MSDRVVSADTYGETLQGGPGVCSSKLCKLVHMFILLRVYIMHQYFTPLYSHVRRLYSSLTFGVYFCAFLVTYAFLSTIYNMSGHVVSADTNSSRRLEFVCPIQHGRECCKWLKKLIIL